MRFDAECLPAKMSNHHYIIGEREHRSLMLSISRGVIPLKYTYSGSSARTHSKFAQTAEYKTITRAVDVELDCLKALNISVIDHIADFGCDTGLHIRDICEPLGLSKGVRTISLFDFSRELGEVAWRRLRPEFPDASVEFEQLDFEEAATKSLKCRPSSRPVLGLLLGNALGNVEFPAEVLRNLKSSLSSGDYLLVSWVDAEYEGRALTFEALAEPYMVPSFIPSLLEPFRIAGMRDEGVQIEIGWDDEYSAVVAIAKLAPATSTSFVCRYGVHCPSQVRCFLSRRFRPGQVSELLSDAGFLPVSSFVDDTHRQSAALAYLP
jgi:uncharacterized SAM-dependent methyltransferase